MEQMMHRRPRLGANEDLVGKQAAVQPDQPGI